MRRIEGVSGIVVSTRLLLEGDISGSSNKVLEVSGVWVVVTGELLVVTLSGNMVEESGGALREALFWNQMGEAGEVV